MPHRLVSVPTSASIAILVVLGIASPDLPVPAVLPGSAVLSGSSASAAVAAEPFEGSWFHGEGHAEHLRMLDTSRRMLGADPEVQSLPMLYTPAWNGFVEGPTWGAWWIQNSYGTTFCALPFLEEPLTTFLQNAQDLWFDQMGDGKRVSARGWVAPDGCLCDAASPGWFMPKQGDGRVDIHDWGMEFTAAGIVLQAELLLISRDRKAIARYLPLLRRCADFIETRRDPETNLFLAGPAGNLLAPSFAGWRRPDGTHGMAYLTGLSVTTIAALDRLIELEKLAGDAARAERFARRRDAARDGLERLFTEKGYLIKSLDPDGTRHGVMGAERHGYLEAVANHDAVCFRVIDDDAARRTMDVLCSVDGLRPHDLVITNYPSLDDLYMPETNGLWSFGTWVNGGHWTTCEARMVMAYHRVGRHEDARRSMRRILEFARAFRLDNPLVGFGSAVYQPREPINLCYDSFGAPAAMLRGLFEYIYRAEGLELIPHVPPGITRLEQRFPVRLGAKRIYIATAGRGPVTAVTVNGRPWPRFDADSVDLPWADTPDVAAVAIALGDATPPSFSPPPRDLALPPRPPSALVKALDGARPVITTNDLPLRIGADSDGGSRLRGSILRALVYRRALTPDEVASLAESAGPGPEPDPTLVGHWDLRRPGPDGHGDLSGGSARARVVGRVETAAEDDGAVRLTGEGYLEVADAERLDLTSGCTLAAWIRPEAQAPGGGRILDKSAVGTSNGYLLDTHPGNSLRIIVERGTLSHDAKLPAGRRVFVAGTASADGTLSLYVDGKRVAESRIDPRAAIDDLEERVLRMRRFHADLVAAGQGSSYRAAHARLAVETHAAAAERARRLATGKLPRLESEASQRAADRSYLETVARLCEGLEKQLEESGAAPAPAPPTPGDLPEGLDDWVPGLLESLKVPGVSIVGIEDRRIAWERHYGVRSAGDTTPVVRETVFEACSMSKLPLAYLALKLEERGVLELDRPLVEYLDAPYLPDEPLHRRITARMVLSHTTGFPNWREGGWRSGNPLPVLFEPGSRFGYSGEGFLYLQRVIEHLTKTPWEEYVQRELFGPLEMAHSSYVWREGYDETAAAGHDGEGRLKKDRRLFRRANAGYSLYTTAHDYARFVVEMLAEDRSAKRSLSAASIERMLTRTTKATGRAPIRRAGPPTGAEVWWGLGWVIDRTSGPDRCYHSGSNGTGFRCYSEFDRERGTGIVIMTNSISGRRLWETIIAAVSPP